MSRYAFTEYAEALLSSKDGVYSPATLQREKRRYARMFRDILQFYNRGEISTMSPGRFTEEDIKTYLSWRRSLGFTQCEYRHEIYSLNQICIFAGSSVVLQVLQRYPLLRPLSGHERQRVLSRSEQDSAVSAAVSFHGGFADIRAAAVFAIALGCGARTKEVQFLEKHQVDLRTWTVTFTHVKGELTYGRPREVPIPPVFHDLLSSYASHRNELPGRRFFCSRAGEDLSSNCLREDLNKIEVVSGVHADFRVLRRTFGQNLLDAGLPIEAVSVLMGHETTKTTEKYYCRLQNSDAVNMARRLYQSVGYFTETPENCKKGAVDRIRTGEPLRSRS